MVNFLLTPRCFLLGTKQLGPYLPPDINTAACGDRGTVRYDSTYVRSNSRPKLVGHTIANGFLTFSLLVPRCFLLGIEQLGT